MVYAEGAGESAGAVSRLPAPGDALEELHLGPIHRLVERCIREHKPDRSVQFLSPLRTPTGITAAGSSLRDRPRELRRLLTFPDSRRAPDLAIIVVDADGDSTLHQKLSAELATIPLSWVLAVPAPEFEAWLLADVATARRIFEVDLSEPRDPEALSPREAKRLYFEWSARGRSALDTNEPLRSARRDARILIFEQCDLALLRRQRSFERFESDLRRALVRCSR